MFDRIAALGGKAIFYLSIKVLFIACFIAVALAIAFEYSGWSRKSLEYKEWQSFIASDSGAFCKRLNGYQINSNDLASIKEKAAEELASRRAGNYDYFSRSNRVNDQGLNSIIQSDLLDWVAVEKQDGRNPFEKFVLTELAINIFSECVASENPGSIFYYSLEKSFPFVLVASLGMAVSVYFLYVFSLLWVRQEHVGWRRVAVVFGVVLSVLVLVFTLLEADGDEDIFLSVVVFAPIAFVVGLLLVLLCRATYTWVAAGFGVQIAQPKIPEELVAAEASDNLNFSTSKAEIVAAHQLGLAQPKESNNLAEDRLIPISDLTVYWRRLWARGIDLFIVYFIFNVVGVFIPEDRSSMAGIVISVLSQAVILSLLLLAYDTLLVYKFGATLGKKILGLEVLSVEHERLTLSMSFSRAKAVLFGGLYFFLFFPYLQIIGAWYARKPTWTGQTKWDAAGRSYVKCRRIGSFRLWSMYLLSALLLVAMFGASKVAKEITKHQVRDSAFSEIVRQ